VAKQKVKNSSLFAQRLASLMREHRLKHRQLAEAAGVSKAAVGKWLRGTTPGARELFKIARALGVTMESFFDAIPYVKPPVEALFTEPPGGVPVNFLKPWLRKLYAHMFEMMSTPQGIEAFLQRSRKLYHAASTLQGAQKNISKEVLTDVVANDNIGAMQDQMQRLRYRLTKATAARGQKAALAKCLGVSLSSLWTWLSGKREPGGETTLRLLQWVEQQERQQNKSPGSATTPPEPKTQSKASNEKKPKSSPQER
jgi:transcriptional regulator with XRE-family HTH domain